MENKEPIIKKPYGLWELVAGVNTSAFTASALLKQFPAISAKCGLQSPAKIANTALVFSVIISTGIGTAMLTNNLRNRGSSYGR